MFIAKEFREVQKRVDEIIRGRILVGHGLRHDLECLLLSHPQHMLRDTSKYKPFRAIANGRTPSLKNLTKEFLKREIQTGSHSSVEDAQCAMELYKLAKGDWENVFARKMGGKRK